MTSILLIALVTVALFHRRISAASRLSASCVLLALFLGYELHSELGIEPGLAAVAPLAYLAVTGSLLALLDRGLASKHVDCEDDCLGALSDRERDIVKALSAGRTQAEIAVSLGVAPSTVSTYRRRAFEKLGIASLEEIRSVERDAGERPRRVSRQLLAIWATMLFLSLAMLVCPDEYAMVICVSIAAIACSACSLICGAVETIGLPSAEALLAFGFGLSYSALLRGVALDFLPGWCGVLPAVSSVVTACLLDRFGVADGLDVAVPVAYLTVFLGAALGFCLGPASSDVTKVQILLIGPVDWRLVLAASVLVAALGAITLTFLVLEKGGDLLPAAADSSRSVLLLRAHGLSELEAEVLVGTAQGETSSSIAARLSIAPATVGSYRLRGYRKLGLHSRQELSRYLSLELG